ARFGRSNMDPDPFSVEERAALYRVIQARRDVRHFLPDPVAPDVLRRMLGAAHLAPSVGFMQPWDGVTSPELHRQISGCLEEQNWAQLEEIRSTERKELYRRLKLEGIVEAPLNLAVTCDRGRDAPFVLGRASMPETDLFSTCLAIQNLWLAARAEGVGVGWV